MTGTCVLGITGRIGKQHFKALDNIVAEQARLKRPINFVKVDPRCGGGVEWALTRGMSIVMERLQWTYVANRPDEAAQHRAIVGEIPTVLEDYASTENYIDIYNTKNPEFADPDMMKPLAGDFLPYREAGRMEGPQVNRVVTTTNWVIPRVEGITVTKLWEGA